MLNFGGVTSNNHPQNLLFGELISCWKQEPGAHVPLARRWSHEFKTASPNSKKKAPPLHINWTGHANTLYVVYDVYWCTCYIIYIYVYVYVTPNIYYVTYNLYIITYIYIWVKICHLIHQCNMLYVIWGNMYMYNLLKNQSCQFTTMHFTTRWDHTLLSVSSISIQKCLHKFLHHSGTPNKSLDFSHPPKKNFTQPAQGSDLGTLLRKVHPRCPEVESVQGTRVESVRGQGGAPPEQWKKNWLFRVYIGDEILPMLYGDFSKPL